MSLDVIKGAHRRIKLAYLFAAVVIGIVLPLQGCVFLLPLIEQEKLPEDPRSISPTEYRNSVYYRKHRGTYRRKKNVSRLIRQLSHSKSVVRTHAATDLGALGANALPAVGALGRALQSDPHKWVRRSAAKALGKIGGKDAAKFLRAGLRDRDSYVRGSTRNALKALRKRSKKKTQARSFTANGNRISRE